MENDASQKMAGDTTETNLQDTKSLFEKLKEEGNELHKQGQFHEALEKYREACEAASTTNDEIAAAYYNIGVTHEKLESAEEAINAYTKALTYKADYEKPLRRRYNLFYKTEQYDKALEDMVILAAEDMKATSNSDDKQEGQGFHQLPSTTRPVVELLLAMTEKEANAVIMKRKDTTPPDYIVEGFLRPLYGDYISRVWKGLEKTPVDEIIQGDNENDLKGYKGALRNLKLRKYADIIDLCAAEIENPESEESKIHAHFLKGTMHLIWAQIDESVKNFRAVIESPNAENKALVERGHPNEAIEMLKVGIPRCASELAILTKTLYWTLKFSLAQGEDERLEAFSNLNALEPDFDIPECSEMFAQALIISDNKEEAEKQWAKAIAYNESDPTFKIKKMIMSLWASKDGVPTPETSIAELNAFMEQNGPHSLAYYQLGQLQIMMEDFENGFKSLDKSIELSSSIHEIEARIASKLEMQFHLKLNERFKQMGLDGLVNQISNLALKSFA